MVLTQKQIDFITENEWIILATSSEGKPRAIMVMPSIVSADEIVISNMQMQVSSQNIRLNPSVFLVSYNKNFSEWIKISGIAVLRADGKLFDEVKKLEAERCSFIPKEIIIVHINSAVCGEEKD